MYANSTISPQSSVVLGDQLLFLGDDSVNGKELWVYDASNDSGWMAADIAVGSDSAWSTYGNLNPMRSGTKVLFEAQTISVTKIFGGMTASMPQFGVQQISQILISLFKDIHTILTAN